LGAAKGHFRGVPLAEFLKKKKKNSKISKNIEELKTELNFF